GKGPAAREVLEKDAEARPAAVGDRLEDALQAVHFRIRELRPTLLIRRSLQSSGVPEERLEERAVERRDLHAGHAVTRGLQDRAVAEPHCFVVDPVLCAEEQEVAGAKSFEGNRDELRILKSLLVTVPLHKHAVCEESPLNEPRAVEPEGPRAAPQIGRAEEPAAEREPFGRGTKGGIFFEKGGGGGRLPRAAASKTRPPPPTPPPP